MVNKRNSIVRKFVRLVIATLTIMLLLSSVIGYINTNNKLKKLYARQESLIIANNENKAALLLEIIGKISPEIILGQDLYGIKSFADPVAEDPDVVSVEILNKEGKTLYKVESKDFKEHRNADLKVYERAVKTDPKKMGTEIVTGSVKLTLSRKHINTVVKQNHVSLSHDKKTNILFSVLQLLITNILVGSFLVIGFQKIVIRPIKDIHTRIKDIAEGEGDLTKRITIEEQNEIGDLASQINAFIEHIHSLIKKIITGTAELSIATQNIDTIAKETRTDTVLVSARSNEVTCNSEHVAENFTTVVNSAQDISTSISSVAVAIEQISATVNEIAKNCKQEMDVSNNANAQASSTHEMVRQLETSANKIGSVLDIISDIADQTNLLALNATIEAASAGEAGKGFAVVANEVKVLAKQTADATSDISMQIGDIRSSISNSVSAIELIAKMVSEVNIISMTIVNAVEEQSATINEISRNVSRVSNGSTDVSNRVKDSATGITDISNKLNEFNTSISKINRGMENVENNTSELAAVTNTIKETADKFRV